MTLLNRAASLIAMISLFAGLSFMVSCSSSPSAEDMKQLNDLKEEYAALQKESSMLSQEKGALEREVAEKNAKLQKCNADQQTVRQRLGK